jgi:hypothetical protein
MINVEDLFGPLIARLRGEFGDELLGVLATGSRIHGTPGPTSDLDVHVVIAQPRRQRRNIVLDGVEIEMFINPAFQIRRYLADGRGNDAHMFAFGRAIYDPHGVVAGLQEEARALWQAGPPPYGEAGFWRPRYVAADMLRDLADLHEDEAASSLQIARLVDQLIETHYRLNRRWPGKPKRRLDELASWAPEAAQLARNALASRPLAERRAAVERLAEQVLAPIGRVMSLEWRTEWEPQTPPAADDEGP